MTHFCSATIFHSFFLSIIHRHSSRKVSLSDNKIVENVLKCACTHTIRKYFIYSVKESSEIDISFSVLFHLISLNWCFSKKKNHSHSTVLIGYNCLSIWPLFSCQNFVILFRINYYRRQNPNSICDEALVCICILCCRSLSLSVSICYAVCHGCTLLRTHTKSSDVYNSGFVWVSVCHNKLHKWLQHLRLRVAR